jgi:hypothetical protein
MHREQRQTRRVKCDVITNSETDLIPLFVFTDQAVFAFSFSLFSFFSTDQSVSKTLLSNKGLRHGRENEQRSAGIKKSRASL